ncbi:glycosyltransferase family 2 protein [Flavobacterium nackdongense]|uniref:Glycosyltransferase family 2 protein n=1 Tax=Flavobacterium nackdongense TaxID=2547394 RepID=A0A4P6YH06_9FLAO|nr:glycosyltransferase family 2 protein [Flavobacterium nackdongense]QBN19860.1 glycosyltransferase family 2 protein [Flavobacterium nackdongense]
MLAIVIPYYKLSFFDETLASLAHQTDKRFKVYIGDDASPEKPTELLEKYEGKFDFVYHRFESNLGGTSLPQQWERCIALSGDEEWVMILGDDDYIGDRVVEEFYAHWPEFQSKSNVVRFASRTIVQEENHQAPICYHPVWESATDAYLRKFKFLTRSSLSEYVFSKKSYEKFGFYNYPLAWNSDDRAWLDFSEDQPIYSINEAVVCSRLSAINITGKKDNAVLKNASLVQFYQFLIEHKSQHYTKFDNVKIIRQYQYVLQCTKKLESKDWLFLVTHYLKNATIEVVAGFLKKYV